MLSFSSLSTTFKIVPCCQGAISSLVTFPHTPAYPLRARMPCRYGARSLWDVHRERLAGSSPGCIFNLTRYCEISFPRGCTYLCSHLRSLEPSAPSHSAVSSIPVFASFADEGDLFPFKSTFLWVVVWACLCVNFLWFWVTTFGYFPLLLLLICSSFSCRYSSVNRYTDQCRF